MAQYFQVLSQNNKKPADELRQFFRAPVQYVINQEDPQTNYQGQQVLLTSEPLMIVEGQPQQLTYQTQPTTQQYVVQEGVLEPQPQPQQQQTQQIFYMEEADACSQHSEHTAIIEQQPAAPPPPVILNQIQQQPHLNASTMSSELQKNLVLQQQLQQLKQQQMTSPQPRPHLPTVRPNLPQINALQRPPQVSILQQPAQQVVVTSPMLLQQRPMQHVPPQLESDKQEAVSLSDGSVVTLADYKKLVAAKNAAAQAQQQSVEINQPKRRSRPANPGYRRGNQIDNNSLPDQQSQQFINRQQQQMKLLNQQQPGGPLQQQMEQNKQQQQHLQAQQRQSKYIIQPPRARQQQQQIHPQVTYALSEQIREIISHIPESNPLSEEYPDSIRMLVLLCSGEQRLITFQLPKEACTIQEILEQVGVNLTSDMNINMAEYPPSTGLNYVVTVGYPPDAITAINYQEQEEIKSATNTTTTSLAVATGPAAASISTTAVEELDDPAVPEQPKESPKYVSGKLAVCSHCGYLSEDFNKCLRCRRKLPEDIKAVPASANANSILKKKHEIKCNFRTNHDNKKSPPKSNGTVKLMPTQAQIAKKKLKPKVQDNEPVILTLSSDEEDNSTPEKKSTDELMQKLQNSNVTLGALRKEPSLKDIEIDSRSKETSVDIEDGRGRLLETTIICRTIRIGSHRFTPQENLTVKSSGLTLKIPHPKDPRNIISITISRHQIVKVLVNFQKVLPVIFYYVFPSVGQEIRKHLDMVEGSEPYFDPLSKEELYKRITILPEYLNEETRKVFKQIYSIPCNIIDELTNKEANDILIKTCPKELTKCISTASITEVKVLLNYPQFSGKGKLTINTEDYVCLAQDQFLNDVIIEFYLNYLIANLPDQMKEKVHIFSTFFYKRLTTKPVKASRRSHPVELDLGLTAAQKRHARVKNWTKNVNLFEKDFIIVPINENAHWFLAIICFPGLNSPMTMDGKPVQLMPKQKKRKAANVGPKVKEREEKPINCEDAETSDKDEAEGDESELDSEEDTSEDTTVTPEIDVGQPIKQPCILIFDSLAGASRSRVVATLRDYLTCEHFAKLGVEKVFNKDVIKGACPKVPQQTNFTDCGLYLLQYVEQFFKDPIKDYHIPIKQLKTWFEEFTVTKKREDISFLIKELMRKTNKDVNILPDITFPTLNGKLIPRVFNDEDEEECEDEEEMEENEETIVRTPENVSVNLPSNKVVENLMPIVPAKVSSCSGDIEQSGEIVANLKPDLSEVQKQSNRDTMSYLKAKRINRHKNTDGTDVKKPKIE